MSGSIPPLPQYTFMAWCSATKKEHRDNFTFTYYYECCVYVFVEAYCGIYILLTDKEFVHIFFISKYYVVLNE
jgi:hypothetical protein